MLIAETERSSASSYAVNAFLEPAIRSANVLSSFCSHSTAENLEQGVVHHLPVTRTGIEFEFRRDLCIAKLFWVLPVRMIQLSQ
jgi:hypothetical protein